MAGETLREFLVSLGFNVDDSSFRKFNSSVLKATEPVLKLGAAVTATATAVSVMVETVARQMEELYYAAQRTNASAASLMAMGFAAKQVGLDAAQGANLIEGLARAMRMNPGTEGVIQSLGVQTRNANGTLRDTSQILNDLYQKLADKPRFVALRFGELLGLNPDTLNQILNNLGPVQGAQERYNQSLRNFGFDTDAATQKSATFIRHLNALESDIAVLAARIGVDLEPRAQKLLDTVDGLALWFGRWNTELGGTPGELGAIGSAMGGIVGTLALFSGGRAAITGVTSALIDMNGWLISIAARLSPIAAFFVTLWGGSLNAGETDFMKKSPGYADAGQADRDKKAASENAGKRASGFWSGALSWFDRKTGLGLDTGGSKVQPPTPAAPLPTAGSLQGGWENVADYLQKKLVAAGISAPVARGVAAGAYAESKLDPTAVNPKSGAFGIGQWLNGRKDDLLKQYGDKPSLDQQIEYLIHELLGGDRGGAAVTGSKTDTEALQNFITKFERPKAGAETYGDLTRGAQALQTITVNQKTEITVSGSGDPAGTAKAVGDAQGRVNGDLARNLSSTVR